MNEGKSFTRNEKLHQARLDRYWTIDEAAKRIQVSRTTYIRWEKGEQSPHGTTLALACDAFKMSAEQLGFRTSISAIATTSMTQPTPMHLVGNASNALTMLEERDQQIPISNQNLYTFADEQLIAFATLLKLGETFMFDPAKRKTLETLLAAMSMTMIKPQGVLQAESWQSPLSSVTEEVKPNVAMLQEFEKLIQGCWQLSRGNELALAEKLLPECMIRLVPIAKQPSEYQQSAAQLASQGYQLYSLFSLHHNDLQAKEHYGKLAVQYSSLSGDQSLLIVSLRQLADTYRYNNQYPQFLQTYLDSLQHVKAVSPLLQSCTYSGLAVAYSYLGRKQDACTYLGLAHDTFPDHPETDPAFSFADFDFPWLILREGMIRSRIGETKKALDAFERINQPGLIIPERIRVEIINQRALAAVKGGDMEDFRHHLIAGIQGARTLGSQKRRQEAIDNWKEARKVWPHETRVLELADLLL
jgi:tetratricopeptide (TPR) repeat protein/DNA-binding XRE family transcriptional regulator